MSETTKKVFRVKVIPVECWSRVVGYYRPLNDWHGAKVEEFERRQFLDNSIDKCCNS